MWDVFLREADGTIRRISVEARDGLLQGDFDTTVDATISGNGRWVIFNSVATNLVPGDVEGNPDAFVHLGTTTWSPEGTAAATSRP